MKPFSILEVFIRPDVENYKRLVSLPKQEEVIEEVISEELVQEYKVQKEKIVLTNRT